MTNYERIKSMSVEELATLLNDIAFFCRFEKCDDCPINTFQSNLCCSEVSKKEWLESEVDEG